MDLKGIEFVLVKPAGALFLNLSWTHSPDVIYAGDDADRWRWATRAALVEMQEMGPSHLGSTVWEVKNKSPQLFDLKGNLKESRIIPQISSAGTEVPVTQPKSMQSLLNCSWRSTQRLPSR